MSPLAQHLIDKLLEEKDSQLLAQVLDFYEYVKHKKEQQNENTWDNISEDEPTTEEIGVIKQYEQSDKQFTDFNSLIEELKINE